MLGVHKGEGRAGNQIHCDPGVAGQRRRLDKKQLDKNSAKGKRFEKRGKRKLFP